jgi:hypothetical protein
MAGGPSNADIYESLGRLAANVEGLRRDFDGSEDLARNHRSRVYNRFDEISRRTGDLETQMKRIEPVVDDLRSLRLKAGGAIIVLAGLGAIIGGLATYFADVIKPLFFRWFN